MFCLEGVPGKLECLHEDRWREEKMARKKEHVLKCFKSQCAYVTRLQLINVYTWQLETQTIPNVNIFSDIGRIARNDMLYSNL